MLIQKQKKNETNNGITLIALIVTIIVLLILAGISIATLAGENGIIAKAEEAKEKTKIAEYKEELEMIRPGLEVEKNMENLTTKEVMDRYEEQIRANPKFQAEGTEIIRKSDSKIRVITPEGYVFDVTMEGVEYKGKQGESKLPDLEEGDIRFKVEPSEWTNKDVEVEIITEYEYVLEYSVDNGNTWIEYKEKQVFSKNIEIIVRGKTELDEIKGYGTLNIRNIDKLNPNAFVVTVENTTTNAITVKGETTDQGKTEQYGSSGIKEYYFSKDDGKTWESNGNKLETTYTFSKLTQGQSYSIKMKAIDNAGNETITSTVKQGTGSVPGGEASIVFGYNPSTWTKGNVTVSISSKESGYIIEYSTDGKTWNKYTTGVAMSSNGAIYARLKDGIGQVGAVATGNVTKIDKTQPTASISAGTVSNKSVTITVSGSDAQSGVAKYEIYVNGTKVKEQTTTATSMTYQHATTFGTSSAYVIVRDAAGNTKQSSSITITDYNIKTNAELSAFSTSVNNGNNYSGKTITLLASLTYNASFTPIGTDEKPFSGTFEGNGKTISGITVNSTTIQNVGLFGYNSGTIRNLGLINSTIQGTYKIAGIAGTNAGSITNCYVSNTTIQTTTVYMDGRRLGGIAGLNKGTIQNCYTTGGKVVCNSGWQVDIGGIAGHGEKSSKIISSSNRGTSINGANSDGSTGGIIGYTQGIVQTSYNTATVSGYGNVGGIAGAIGNAATVTSCYTTGAVRIPGNIASASNGFCLGGIVGWNDGGSTVSNSYNRGSVTANTTTGSMVMTGGIVGFNCANLTKCYNTGTVSGKSGNIQAIADNQYSGKVTYCYSLSGSSASLISNGNGGTSSNVEFKSATDLKNLYGTLGMKSGGSLNNGYPILSWQ